MVLHFCGCGRVGRCRFIFEEDPVSKDAGFLLYVLPVCLLCQSWSWMVGGEGMVVNARWGRDAKWAIDAHHKWKSGNFLKVNTR